MKKQVWYKEWIWYYHFLLFCVFLGFLLWGLYLAVFVEHWYFKNNNMPEALINYDILMSFYSVQVNIATIVWLLFYLINFNKRTGGGITSNRFRMTIMNLNLVVFIIFWIGIIVYMNEDLNFLKLYTNWQIICTVVTHFICPLSLILIYFFTSGNEQYKYLNMWKYWDIYITYIYSFLYMIYVFTRGKIYGADNINIMKWPYPFLDFDNLFVGSSIIGYMVLITIVFVIWLSLNHWILIFINNCIYKIRKNNNKY
ncbi:hypothetical protein SCULI_v1c07820 [Spiroplasma culicicola AES-1]|uniref:Transmembrane protein n=1 Tax=Spiroplasma culicicola AES-1 TaxID=1276246 RepID=W6A7K8_9MOLU|nr:hypothetical protein SCULI_v1c07820 [Spiroplasma culicicola AES-1]